MVNKVCNSVLLQSGTIEIAIGQEWEEAFFTIEVLGNCKSSQTVTICMNKIKIAKMIDSREHLRVI